MTTTTATFHTLRYAAGTHLDLRKHRFTQVRAASWVEAEDARLLVPMPWRDRLEVVERPLSRVRQDQPR